MATVQEEYSKIQTDGNRPVPGLSLTNDPENPAPYEKAPKFTSVHRASEYIWEKFIQPETYISLMGSVAEGVPLADLAQIILFKEFQEGAWNPDLMLMLFEPTVYMIMALAERLDLPMTIYEGELEDEDSEEQILGTAVDEQKIKDMIERGSSGKIPEGTLNAEMQKSLENLPEIDVKTPAASLMALPSEEAMPQPQSLMAPPVTAGV
jgi:hypothetical protein|tara:strand:+ start:1536 stop:2159 length:624 start_codon:yes stop_codon:yes gene_type:complete